MSESLEQALESIVGGILFCLAVTFLLLLFNKINTQTEKLTYRQEHILLAERK